MYNSVQLIPTSVRLRNHITKVSLYLHKKLFYDLHFQDILWLHMDQERTRTYCPFTPPSFHLASSSWTHCIIIPIYNVSHRHLWDCFTKHDTCCRPLYSPWSCWPCPCWVRPEVRMSGPSSAPRRWLTAAPSCESWLCFRPSYLEEPCAGGPGPSGEHLWNHNKGRL